MPNQSTDALVHFAAKGIEEKVKQLLDERRDSINGWSTDGRVPIVAAAGKGRVSIVRLMLDAGGDPNLRQRCAGKSTALIEAIIRRRDEVVSALLDAGADPNVPDEFGRTAMHYAAMFDRSDLVKSLAIAGADIDVRDKEGHTPLLVAYVEASVGTVTALKSAGARESLRRVTKHRFLAGLERLLKRTV